LNEQRLPLGDPEPPTDIRKAVTVFMRPSIKAAVDLRRDKQKRSVWIEEAIRERIRREDDRSTT
jgi:hypothetical protein